MKSNSLQMIEKELPLLSQEEQLWLIEHLTNHLQKKQRRDQWRASLDAMAKDPQIQEEIRKINKEFAVAESDGLEAL